MDLQDLKYEVQRIDGSPGSVLDAITLIVEQYRQQDYIPKSIEYGFFEEFYTCLLDWVGLGQDQNIQKALEGVNKVITSDNDFASPFAGSSSKRRFGAQLNFMSEFMEVYLRSDLQIKDEYRLKGQGKSSKRLRHLLWITLNGEDFFDLDSLVVSAASIYDGMNRKTIERDLQKLVELSLVRKRTNSSRSFFYELTNRAYQFREILNEEFLPERSDSPYLSSQPPARSLAPLSHAKPPGSVLIDFDVSKRLFPGSNHLPSKKYRL